MHQLSAADLVPAHFRATLPPNLDADAPTRASRSDVLVLFVDMSGFSRIASEFIARSERGAEDLRAAMSTVYDVVVQAITAHGGSVLYYAGDAVTAIWPGASADRTTSCQHAIACGLAIQKECKDLPVLATGDGVQMKASVLFAPDAAGLWTLDLQLSPGARQALFCGPALDALATGTQSVASDGVTVPAPVFDMMEAPIRAACQYAQHGNNLCVTAMPPVTVPASPAIDPQGLEVFVPTFLRSDMGLDASDWLAEFRMVNVLFARVPGFKVTLGADGQPDTAVFNAMAQSIAAQGGALIQLCQDDKGLVCIAAWGLAKSAFENAAARAVQAADDIHAELHRLGHPAHIAVASGKSFAGLVGARPLMQYAIVGDVLSRAASMAVKAVAPVVMDNATQQALPAEIVTDAIATITLKGRTTAEQVFVTAGQRLKSVEHRGAIVGRHAERAALTDRLRALQTGALSDIRIFAAAGLGKSRLAAWFEQEIGATDILCLRMNADHLRQSTSYLPLRQIFAQLLDWPEGLGAEEALSRITALFDANDTALQLLPLLSPVLPRALDPTEYTASLIGAGRAELTRDIVVRLLQRLLQREAARATVLLIEDAHWLDSASWLCIEAARRDIDGLSLVIVTRPIDEDQVPTEVKKLLFEDSDALHLAIGPLSQDDTGVILMQTLGVREVSRQITELVYREAAGHPLYTTALAGSLMDRGLIRIADGYARLHLGDAALSSVTFPHGVKGVIAERISGLDLHAQLGIKTAAVLGRNFDLTQFSSVFPMQGDAETHQDLIARLTHSGLIEELGDDRFRFHHAIIADCAHEMLTTEQAQSLHNTAGQTIETALTQDDTAASQEQLALMAYHFEHAGAAAKAIGYLDRASVAARRNYGNLEVVDFLSRAIALSPVGAGQNTTEQTLRLARWKVQIAESLRALGQYQRAEAFLKDAIAALDRPVPETGMQAAGQLLREFGRFKLRRHREAQPEPLRAPIITAADANMMLSEIHYELNKIPFALSEILKGVNLARRAGGDSETLSKLYIGMALISTSLPWALDGDDLQARALDIADRLNDPATPSWVYMVSGVYETGKGGWERGEAQLNHSREMSEACGERKTWETAMSCLGNHKRLEGYFELAKGWSDLTLQASKERGIDHGVIWSHNGRARDLLCLSGFDELRGDVEALERLLNDPAKTGDSNDNNNLVYHYAASFCALLDGQDDLARAEFDTVIERLKGIKRPQVYMVQNVDYYSDILWALWHRGQRDDALMASQVLVARSGKQVAKQYRTGAPMGLLAKGDGAWFRGDTKTAQAAWVASVNAANERVMPYCAAHALYRLDQTGLEREGVHDPRSWSALLAEIGIERPVIWDFG